MMTAEASSLTSLKQRQQNYLFTIYSLIVLYAICFQLQRPIEPFLIDRLIDNNPNNQHDHDVTSAQQTYGNLQTIFNICQMIGSLIFGTIIDSYGIRVGFIINFLACASSYYLLSQATTIEFLYFSKIPGMFMAGFLVGQSACLKGIQSHKHSIQENNVDIDASHTKTMKESSSNQRINVLGKLTASYTVGATVGPTIGGLLGASGDYYLGAKLACWGSLLCVAIAWFALPNVESHHSNESSTTKTHDDENNKQHETDHDKSSFLRPYLQALQISGVFLSIKAVTSVANSMASTVQPLILKNQLSVSEKGLGLFMSFTFCVGGLVNAFGLDKISDILGSAGNQSLTVHVNGNGEVRKKRDGKTRLVVKNSILGMFFLYSILSFTYSTIGTGFLDIMVELTGMPSIKQFPYITTTLILSILQFTLSTAITAETTSLVPKEIRGTMISLEHSIFSAPRIVAPTIGVAVYGLGDISGLCLSCAIIFLSVLYGWTRLVKDPVNIGY